MRRILLTTSREQTEAYAHGLPNNTLQDYNSLKNVLNQKFGHKDLFNIVKAKQRRKKGNNTFRDFGQAIKDYKELFRVIGNS